MKSKYLLLELLACLFLVLPTKSYSISFDQNNITVGSVNNLDGCGDVSDGGSSFDLTVNNSLALNGLSANDYSVYYFNNQSDSDSNIISSAIQSPDNYFVSNFSLNQIWVNVVENADTSNFGTSTFLLFSNESPQAFNPGNAGFFGNAPHYKDCSSGPTFDLTTLDDAIIGNQNGNFIVSYFNNIQDANNNTNAIANPENFDLNANTSTLFTTDLVARIEFDDGTDCFDTTSFVFSTYQSNNNDFDTVDFSKCANDDGTATFDLTEGFIINNNNLDIVQITYDVFDEAGNQIGNSVFQPESYTVNTFQEYTVQVNHNIRLNPNITGFCFLNKTFTIQAFETPQVEAVNDLTACSSNQNLTYDLTLNNDLAIGNQTGNYNISYHFTLPDAENDINSVEDLGQDPANFDPSNVQQFMFVRIENVESEDCYSVDFFTLETGNTFSINPPDDLSQCETENDDDIIFDLTQNEGDILGNNQNLSDFGFEYFDENNNLISTPDAYISNNAETISVDVFPSQDLTCVASTDFDLIILGSDDPECNLSISDPILKDLKIFPNPAHQFIKLESGINLRSIKIFDVNGKLVLDKKLSRPYEININGFHSGIYFVKIESKKASIARRIIIE